MRLRRQESWIFDAYPEPEGMRVWVLGRDGGHGSLLDPWRPRFHIGGDERELRRALSVLRPASHPVSCRLVERLELFSDRSLPVLEVEVPPLARDPLVRELKRSGFQLHDADIHLGQLYHYDRGHFPLALCSFELEGGRILSWELLDDPWSLDYEQPPLRSARLALSGSEVAGGLDPNQAPRGRLVLDMDGTYHELEGPMEQQLETLAARLEEWDPDVLLTEWGDSFLVPRLAELAARAGRELPFSRDAGRGVAGRGSRSFYTYGRTVYQGGARYFFGRWHLDLKNSFLLKECGTDGLFEMARVARIPVQRAARCTIGTSLSSMQMEYAWRRGILIPMDKAQAEDFRPATELLAADKGGLVYEPEVGWHEKVVELDFVSMYPTLMVKHNISPETVNCGCCKNEEGEEVPGLRHRTCRRRRGLVPTVLAPILEKRARCKALAKGGGPRAAYFKRLAAAHKWTLVCSFGYLGFKNARFGKIEAHECVTAWGREVLLKAKEAVEARGARVLHGLVDSLWIQVPPGTGLEALRLDVEREAGCPLGLEGVYKWLRFCPSKEDALSGVPGRYFGALSDGELKVRGLACRRRDTPALLKGLQERMLARLARAGGLAACRDAVPELEAMAERCRARLRDGSVSAPELSIRFHLSKSPEDYVHDTLPALAAKQLAAAGLTLHPGEAVSYVIVSAKDAVKDWRVKPLALLEGGLEYDAKKYLELLDRCVEEVLGGLDLLF